MQDQLKTKTDETLHYRYNPQADVLAVRLEPDFGSATETPVDHIAGVSISRDDQGKTLGFRIEGVQSMILRGLIRGIFDELRPQLEAAGAVEAPPALDAPGAATPSPNQVAVISRTPDADGADGGSPVADFGNQDEDKKNKKRKRRRRRKQREDEGAEQAVAESAPPVTAERATSAPADEPADASASSETSGSSGQDGAVVAAEPVSHEREASAPDASARDRNEAASTDHREAPAAEVGDAVAAPAPPAAHAEPSEPALEPDALASTPAAEPKGGLRTGWGQRPAPQRFLRKLKPGGAKENAADAPEIQASNGGSASATGESDESADDAPGSPSPAGAQRDTAADDAADPAEPVMTVTRTAGGLATGWSQPEPAEEAAPQAEPIDESELAESFTELGLHPTLLESIEDMGFSVPTPIQAAAIPAAMKGRDVVGLAQTGTGKTLAFVAPGLHRMLEDSDTRHRARVLVLAPTRELTVQVAQEAERIAARSNLRVATIYGGVAMGPQIDALKRGADLIVATPGRMLDHLRRGNASMGEVETLVLDEADRMLDMGFLPDVRTIMRFLPEARQTLLFTATMPPEIESLSLEFQKEPKTVEIARRKPPASIDQRLYPVGKHLKVPLLVHLLKNEPEVDRVLIFTERKIDADNLGSRLRQEGIDCALMHGDRRQSDREKALRRLRDREVRVLVATNVAARGLDIEGISHVINFDIPQTVDEYVHRIGRTARADATGKAYSLVTMGDEIMVTRIESALERELPRHEAEGFDYDVPAPSWAKPSPKDVIAMLGKEQSRSDRLRGLGRRR